MLKINNEIVTDIRHENFSIEKSDLSGVTGYFLTVSIDFYMKNRSRLGYLDLSAGWQDEGNVRFFLDRDYSGVPFGGGSIGYFEVFDTRKLHTSNISNKVYVRMSEMENNKVRAKISLEDDLINVEYDGYLEYI